MTALTTLPVPRVRHSSSLSALLAVALAATFVSAALAQDVYAPVTLDFNDLGPATGGIHMPDSYGGLNWLTSDWHYMTLALAPADDFLALSGNATGVVGTGGQDFYFDGADFWSRRGLDANGRFYFILHLNGVLVYNGLEDPDGRQVFTNVHQLFTANYTGLVDHVAMAFDQGGDDWDHLAMDNVRLRTIVPAPEPGTASLLLLSTLALGFRRTRRLLA